MGSGQPTADFIDFCLSWSFSFILFDFYRCYNDFKSVFMYFHLNFVDFHRFFCFFNDYHWFPSIFSRFPEDFNGFLTGSHCVFTDLLCLPSNSFSAAERRPGIRWRIARRIANISTFGHGPANCWFHWFLSILLVFVDFIPLLSIFLDFRNFVFI